jgi:hypothetical protein
MDVKYCGFYLKELAGMRNSIASLYDKEIAWIRMILK